ncbi:MAG: C1 family peptidase [Omnitrophica WOR_2 bacterium]
MKKNISIHLVIASMFIAQFSIAQQPGDKGTFKVYEPGYFQNSILKGIEDYEAKDQVAPANPVFKAEVPKGVPTSKDGFKQFWHNDPVSQGNTNTCWSFSTTSFLESEVNRITGQKVRISEMFTVYNEYLERAEALIKTRGGNYFGEGSEANAVTKIMKKYGCVPYESYTGLLPGQKFYSHEKMFNELRKYVEFVKTNNLWDEQAVMANFKSILNHYMGEPPATVKINGKEMTPKEYMTSVLKLNPDDYCDVLSYMQKPYWKQVEYQVPDNWWHSADYYNLPLTDFMQIIKKSIKAGYTLSIGGDVSEAGLLAREANAAIVPSFDIPSAYIDDNARQFRFSNETTTDDHGMHLVGYMEKDGVTWFLIKDSGSGSRNGGKEKNPNFGYYFFHEDYVKLKMMDFMVHKDMMKDYLPKFQK